MADLFYTLLIAWVLWRIFGSTSVKTHVFHHYDHAEKEPGKVTISKSTKNEKQKVNTEGEYVDYEEIK
jgi:hypothetical protein